MSVIISKGSIENKIYTFMTFYHQIIESIEEKNFSHMYENRIFRNRILVPVEMDLTGEISFCGHKNPEYEFLEILISDLEGKKYSYIVKSRYYAALRKLKKGFRCFAVVKDRKIIGDVWCTKTQADGKSIHHNDAFITGLCCRDWEAYAFNLTVAPSYRGMKFAIPLQRFLQASLKNEGHSKVYGFYWEDNVQALWMHRLLKFKEYPKRKITRVLMYSKIENYESVEKDSINGRPLPEITEYCWDYFNCFEETKKACPAYTQTQKNCWELFLEGGELRQNCKICKFRLAQTPSTLTAN